MVSGMVRRLVEIELGSNATDAQVILSLERRASLEISGRGSKQIALAYTFFPIGCTA